MVEFACENTEMERHIRLLCDRITACGGYIDDRLTIGERGGDFIVRARPDIAPKDPIIKVPKDHLLPVDKYTIGVEGNDFVLRDHDKALPPTQVALMETMLTLYNLAGKVESHKKICLWQLHKLDPDLLEKLLAARTQPAMDFRKKLPRFSEEDFIVESYLKTRILGVKNDKPELTDAQIRKVIAGKGVNIKGKQIQTCMLPLIDFVNHNIKAAGFNMPKAEEPTCLSIFKSAVVEGSQECFARYGYHDALDTLIYYNFVDWYPIFVRSVPMEMDVPDFGKVVIYGGGGIADLDYNKVPQSVANLGIYLPNVILHENPRCVAISHLLIPQKQAPRALRRVLAFALQHLGQDKSEAALLQAVDYAHHEIINRNLAFYDDLEIFLDNRQVADGTEMIVANIREMIRTQRANIDKYPLKGISTDNVQDVLAQ